VLNGSCAFHVSSHCCVNCVCGHAQSGRGGGGGGDDADDDVLSPRDIERRLRGELFWLPAPEPHLGGDARVRRLQDVLAVRTRRTLSDDQRELVATTWRALLEERARDDAPTLLLGDGGGGDGGGGGLYLGCYWNALSLSLMRDELGVTHVLNCAVECERVHVQHFDGYEHIALDDHEHADAAAHFARAHRFIADALAANGRVFVHCQQGRSRAATLVCAHLLHANDAWSLADTLAYVRARRPHVDVNAGFLNQLIELELRLRPDAERASVERRDISDAHNDM